MMSTTPTEPSQHRPEDLVARAKAALANVFDPELGLDVVSLGLIYDIRVTDDGVEVDMTLTTPGCPVSEQLPAEALDRLQQALPEVAVHLDVVWQPPWSPERLSAEALESLGFH